MRTKKPVRSAVILALILSLLLTSVMAAQFAPSQLPGSGWWTGIQLQNVGGETAAVSIQAYPRDPDVSVPAAHNIEGGIPAGGQTTLNPIQLGLPEGFEGSAVVSSNQPLNAVTNVTNRYSSGGALGTEEGRAAGQYQGIQGMVAASEISFPLVKNDLYGKTTTFYVQNAGSGDATATATYRVAGGTFTQALTIPEGRTVVLVPADAGVPTGNGSLGALRVTSTSGQALAGVSLEHRTAEPVATILQATRALVPSDRASNALAPIIKHDFGDRTTGIQVVNAQPPEPAARPITITIKFKKVVIIVIVDRTGQRIAADECPDEPIPDDVSPPLEPGESYTFVPGSRDHPSNLPPGCLASATITTEDGGDGVVAVVNEAFVPSKVGEGQAHRYDAAVTSLAIAAPGATRWVSAPLYKENAFSKTTGLQIQNAGEITATNVIATFSCGGGGGTTQQTYVTKPQTIPPGGAHTFVTMWRRPEQFNGPPIPADVSGFAGICSAIVESDQPIVGIANESSYPFFNFPETEDNLEQDKNNYEAFNLAADPTP